jgi:putative transposase
MREGYFHRVNYETPMIGYIKGKSAIHLARVYRERKRISCPPWAGIKAVVREYIRKQDQEDQRLDQLSL